MHEFAHRMWEVLETHYRQQCSAPEEEEDGTKTTEDETNEALPFSSHVDVGNLNKVVVHACFQICPRTSFGELVS